MGCHALLQGTFLTQGLSPGLLHRRWNPSAKSPGKPQYQEKPSKSGVEQITAYYQQQHSTAGSPQRILPQGSLYLLSSVSPPGFNDEPTCKAIILQLKNKFKKFKKKEPTTGQNNIFDPAVAGFIRQYFLHCIMVHILCQMIPFLFLVLIFFLFWLCHQHVGS